MQPAIGLNRRSTSHGKAPPARRRPRHLLLIAVSAWLETSLAVAGPTAAEPFQPILDFRLRAEHVDQSGLPNDAQAITLRARAGFETAKVSNTSFLAESDLLWPLESRYNSTVNGKTAYPVVADAETYEVNRLQLTNTSLADTILTLGRQRINLDDQRFVGNVGWRQNEQTYDGVRVVNKAVKNLTVDATYFNQVNRVFGKDSPVGRYHGDNYLANIAYTFPVGKLTGFAYLTDFDEAPGDSAQTLGARFTREKPLRKLKVAAALSWAQQTERANNPLNFSLDSYAAEVTATLRQYSLGLGYEVLEGNGARGFSTPLATLHRFDGWADKFLTTPPAGLEDLYLTAGYSRAHAGPLDSLAVIASYHHFDAQHGAGRYGSELDLQLQAKHRRYTALIKYADYQAHGFATDTRKWWLQLEYQH